MTPSPDHICAQWRHWQWRNWQWRNWQLDVVASTATRRVRCERGLSNTDTWARNNLILNRKVKENRLYRLQTKASDCTTTVDVTCNVYSNSLGVTITNCLSASAHVREVINSCAQTLYAYEGYWYLTFWTEGYSTPTFQNEKVTTLLSPARSVWTGIKCSYSDLFQNLKAASHEPTLTAVNVGRHFWRPTLTVRVSRQPTMTADKPVYFK